MAEESGDPLPDLDRIGDPAAAASQGFAAIRAGRADRAAWYRAGLGLALLGEGRLLGGLVDLADRHFEPGPVFFNTLMILFRLKRRYSVFFDLFDRLPETGPVKALGCYYCGCGLVAQRRLDEALPWFRRFREALPDAALAPPPFLDDTMTRLLAEDRLDEAERHFDSFTPRLPAMRAAHPFIIDDNLNLVLRQGRMMATVEEVAALRTRPPPAMVEDFTEIAGTAGPAELSANGAATVFVSADEGYVRTYLPGFIETLARHGVPLRLHVNVIDAGPETASQIIDLARRHPCLGVEISTVRAAFRSSTVFACARMLVVPEILRRRPVPLIALDIDGAVEQRLLALASPGEARDASDFAVFDSGRDEPASVYPAGVMLFSPSPRTLAFLDDVGRVCAARAHELPRFNWMLDQAAILSVAEAHRAEGSGLRFGILNHSLGCTMAEVVSDRPREDGQKHGLRAGLRAFQVLPAAGAGGGG